MDRADASGKKLTGLQRGLIGMIVHFRGMSDGG